VFTALEKPAANVVMNLIAVPLRPAAVLSRLLPQLEALREDRTAAPLGDRPRRTISCRTIRRIARSRRDERVILITVHPNRSRLRRCGPWTGVVAFESPEATLSSSAESPASGSSSWRRRRYVLPGLAYGPGTRVVRGHSRRSQ
jgi:hypothetical protein